MASRGTHTPAPLPWFSDSHSKVLCGGKEFPVKGMFGLAFTPLLTLTQSLEQTETPFTVCAAKATAKDVKGGVVVFLSVSALRRSLPYAKECVCVVLDGPLSLASLSGITILDHKGTSPYLTTGRPAVRKTPDLTAIRRASLFDPSVQVCRINFSVLSLEQFTNGGLIQRIMTMVFNNSDIDVQESLLCIVKDVMTGDARHNLSRDTILSLMQSLAPANPFREKLQDQAVTAMLSEYGAKVSRFLSSHAKAPDDQLSQIEKEQGIKHGDLRVLRRLLLAD